MGITEGQIFAPQISVEQQILIQVKAQKAPRSECCRKMDLNPASAILKPFKLFFFIAPVEGKSPFLTQYLFGVCLGALILFPITSLLWGGIAEQLGSPGIHPHTVLEPLPP